MSPRLRLATPATVKFGASVTVSTAPSLALTLKLCPSSFSTVPRTAIGVPSGFCAGGACANAGAALRPSSAAASKFRMRIGLGLPCRPCSARIAVYKRGHARPSHRRLDPVLLGRDAGRGQAAVRLLQRADEDEGAGLQQAWIAGDEGDDRHVGRHDHLGFAVLMG